MSDLRLPVAMSPPVAAPSAAAPSGPDAATSYGLAGLAGTATPSITHATTSYGQVIEYIQSKFQFLLCWRRITCGRCIISFMLLT